MEYLWSMEESYMAWLVASIFTFVVDISGQTNFTVCLGVNGYQNTTIWKIVVDTRTLSRSSLVSIFQGMIIQNIPSNILQGKVLLRQTLRSLLFGLFRWLEDDVQHRLFVCCPQTEQCSLAVDFPTAAFAKQPFDHLPIFFEHVNGRPTCVSISFISLFRPLFVGCWTHIFILMNVPRNFLDVAKWTLAMKWFDLSFFITSLPFLVKVWWKGNVAIWKYISNDEEKPTRSSGEIANHCRWITRTWHR